MAEPTTIASVDAAARPLKWGVLGTGRIARKLLTAIQKVDAAQAWAVASRKADRARQTADEFAAPRGYTYDDLVNDPEVEVVYNSLPNALHAEWTIRLLEAGKHVLSEKPFSATVWEAEEMMRAARTNNVLLMEAFMYRFHPQWRRVEEIVRSGHIGTVRFIRSAFMFRMDNFEDIRFSAPLAGGALMDVGCYCVNFSRYIASLENPGTEPVAVYAAANFHANDDGSPGVDETLAGTLRFPAGVLAQFVCSLRMPGGVMGEIVGDRGKIEIAHPWLGGNPPKITVTTGGTTSVEEIPEADNYAAEVAHFCDCILHGTPLLLPPEDA
ncbi:MAG: Gfo/Idh/MocA family oxidoreductase, partial [Armatimonadota bacterium]|nr:Gfo/Idh/MocA family oxidoreductase [Armatimonadota bacterium]